MDANGIVDLKITDYYNTCIIVTDEVNDNEKGYLTEDEMEKARIFNQVEMTYHKRREFFT